MSSDVPARVSTPAPVAVPHTAVPLGLNDPVEKARAELKAALAAIEVKANVPRRVSLVGGDLSPPGAEPEEPGPPAPARQTPRGVACPRAPRRTLGPWRGGESPPPRR